MTALPRFHLLVEPHPAPTHPHTLAAADRTTHPVSRLGPIPDRRRRRRVVCIIVYSAVMTSFRPRWLRNKRHRRRRRRDRRNNIIIVIVISTICSIDWRMPSLCRRLGGYHNALIILFSTAANHA